MIYAFPSCVQDKLFHTNEGDICLRLCEAWSSLLPDLGLLGPAILISRNDQLAIVSYCRQFDFVEVPESTETLELSSGLRLDTQSLTGVIVGQEAHTGAMGIHFFDQHEEGIFKVLLSSGTNLDCFALLLQHYAKCSLESHQSEPFVSSVTEPNFACYPSASSLQRAWPFFNPASGGSFLPRCYPMTWLDALRIAGHASAFFLARVGLIKSVLAAQQNQLRLRVTLWNGSLHHETLLTPRRLERCGQCFHIFDHNSEAHLFLDSALQVWVGIHGLAKTAAIHLISPDGERHGLIQCVGPGSDQELWQGALTAAVGT